MRTHVALLRGVNVGGHNRLAMADLEGLAAGLGLRDVATYVQSGNLIFTSELDASTLASSLRRAIAADLGVTCDVVVVSAADLRRAVAANPFPVDDPKKLHLIFRTDPVDADGAAAVEAAQASARQKGSQDRAVVAGATLYLHTPAGLGRSDLAARLGRLKGGGTARNWSTVTALVELLDR